MKMGMLKTDPENRKVTTDPGIAPPSSDFRQDADAPPELPPLPTRLGGDSTPVPPEVTDGLLSGLIAGENEAYFRRAKAAPATNGDAAAAFHGGPHPLSVGSPTPPPEEPVLLRSSVEKDIAEMSVVRASRPDGIAQGRRSRPDEATDPDPAALRASKPPPEKLVEKAVDRTLPLPAPRSPGTEVLLAFAAAALAVGVVAVLLTRGLSGSPATAASPSSTSTSGVASAAASAPPPPAPPPPQAPSPPPAPPVATAATPVAPAPSPSPPLGTTALAGKPAAAPPTIAAQQQPKSPASTSHTPRTTAPRASSTAAAAPPGDGPQPSVKDDVKRSM